eukprot:TRINITY_DN1501_c0_g1_i1.p1 TRINITY_DN1501_c0_g1~~TRINITY_DN1501_c0_g1_i1.p1  ORF type:complete len:588 (+),score=148.09 TRINITY_DN1501_c0_g1_i1:360-2123(+)
MALTGSIPQAACTQPLLPHHRVGEGSQLMHSLSASHHIAPINLINRSSLLHRNQTTRNRRPVRASVNSPSPGEQSKCPFADVPGFPKGENSHSERTSVETKAAAGASVAVSKPHKEIPGSYGIPFFGPLKDKLDYFAFKGWFEYIQGKKDQYNSSVVRVNWPRFNGKDTQVVLLLDQASYPTLYDNAKVDKKDLFFGPYRPSLGYTDGVRILAYLDPTEEAHTQAKKYCRALLAKYSKNALKAITERSGELFANWESQIEKKGVAEVYDTFYEFIWAYLVKTFNFTTVLPNGGHIAKAWVGPQLLPIINLGAPSIVEALLKLIVGPLPAFIVKGKLDTLLEYHKDAGREAVHLGKEYGLSEHESVVHLMYFIAFNAHGAIVGVWASVLTAIALYGGKPLMAKLSEEVRSAAAKYGNGELTHEVIANLPLLDSVIYETLRTQPPIAVQHARAREDIVIESHDAQYTIPKGQIIAGHAYWPQRDPAIFDEPDKWIPDRFMGEGAGLLRYLLWSNGRQTEDAVVTNKQCPGKDFVPEGTKIFLANLFLRYKAYELSGDAGWSTVKVVPGPGLKEMKLGTQKLLFKSLQRA